MLDVGLNDAQVLEGQPRRQLAHLLQHAQGARVGFVDLMAEAGAALAKELQSQQDALKQRILDLRSQITVVEGQGVAVRETWKKTGDGWKLKSVQQVSDESVMASKKGEKKRAS